MDFEFVVVYKQKYGGAKYSCIDVVASDIEEAREYVVDNYSYMVNEENIVKVVKLDETEKLVMKRVIYIKSGYSVDDKYVLVDEYNGFGIYNKMTPSGYFVSQDWLLSNNDNAELVIQSYNDLCKEELLDMIDNYNNTNKFGVKAVMSYGSLRMHSHGELKV